MKSVETLYIPKFRSYLPCYSCWRIWSSWPEQHIYALLVTQPYLLPFFDVPNRGTIHLVTCLQRMRLLVFAVLGRCSRSSWLLAVHVSRLYPNPARRRAALPGPALPPVPATQPRAHVSATHFRVRKEQSYPNRSQPEVTEGIVIDRLRKPPFGLAVMQNYKLDL